MALMQDLDSYAADQQLVKHHLDNALAEPQIRGSEIEAHRAQIKRLLQEKNAVLVAHYYTDPEIQSLAEETGGCVSDSLEMARFGNEHPADTLVVAGVKFMGETAKVRPPKF